jgi:hypothetical protein
MRQTGGCQCGAVRYAASGELGRASICHCRMCQKAFGSFFGPFVSIPADQFTWTRGQPSYFQSSNKVRRGFCRDCGTPLTYEWSPSEYEVSIGSFDDPTPLKPVIQLSPETAMPWLRELADLPARDAPEAALVQGHYEGLVSNQHPDHDTESWPHG